MIFARKCFYFERFFVCIRKYAENIDIFYNKMAKNTCKTLKTCI